MPQAMTGSGSFTKHSCQKGMAPSLPHDQRVPRRQVAPLKNGRARGCTAPERQQGEPRWQRPWQCQTPAPTAPHRTNRRHSTLPCWHLRSPTYCSSSQVLHKPEAVPKQLQGGLWASAGWSLHGASVKSQQYSHGASPVLVDHWGQRCDAKEGESRCPPPPSPFVMRQKGYVCVFVGARWMRGSVPCSHTVCGGLFLCMAQRLQGLPSP